ncbi:L,D-transpeptidase [Nostoc sp. TCL26-01]|uniref:L,D-transpeptidase n=1 Tax=Nostoc sp. TCL26-01 TaxID=2576904 RepID=UPI0015C01A8B|nr:L,D-transpeptidase [Nostoc sp. TCL26-01]QLE57768.1 L,D-transpeptidase [Nostoc sp. TCL26-01]
MAMVRNESVGRMVMFLCFGTAVLSLAVYWRITTTQGQFKKQISASLNRPGGVYRGGLGETAFGASAPPGGSTLDKNSSSQSSAIKSGDKSDTVNQNVNLETSKPNKTQVLTPAIPKNSDSSNQSDSIFPQLSLPKPSPSKLSNGKKEVVVDLSDRRTYVYSGDVVIASYPIAIGKKGWETPTGTFKVKDMQHDPIWRHPITGKVFPSGTDSPLGERWIGFWSDGRNEIGFHGTPETHLLGTAISHGCLRMRNADVRLLYDQVEVGTSVVVQN